MGFKAFIIKTANTAWLGLKKHSPEIFTVTGIATGVAATVLACKETLKAGEVISRHKERIEKIHEAKKLVDSGEVSENEYDAASYRRDLFISYTQTAVDWLRLYGPSIVVGGLAIVQILAGHHIIAKRNVAISSAYTALNKAFKEYRERVKKTYGDDVDYQMRTGAERITTPKVDELGDPTGENDEKLSVKKDQTIGNHDTMSRFFDEYNPYWKKDPYANKIFLKARQAEANDLLRAKGHLFLNDVYDMLGFEDTKEGAVVGWAISNDGSTSNHVDFGIFNGDSEAVRRFVNGDEASILLDFNCDGIIYDIL